MSFDLPIDWKDIFRAKVLDLKIKGDNALGLCPFHEDGRPSFSVNIQTSQWLCFAGCGKGNYWDFKRCVEDPSKIARTTPQIEPQRAKGKSKQAVPLVIKEIYTYKDEGGTPCYEVRRYEPKSFSQHSINKDGSRLKGLNGAAPLPYNLPEIVSRPDELLWWVEGEKDVQTLNGLGLLATTTSGGANGWKPEVISKIKNKIFMVIPDQDMTGQTYAAHVRKALTLDGRIVFNLDLPVKDVTDYLNMDGNSKESLLKTALQQSIHIGNSCDPIQYFKEQGISIPDWALTTKHKTAFLVSVTRMVFSEMEEWSDRFKNPVDLIDLSAKEVINKSTYLKFIQSLKELHETRRMIEKLH